MKKGVIYSLVAGAVVIFGLVGVYFFGAVFSDSSTGENIFEKNWQAQKRDKNDGNKKQTEIFLTVMDGTELIKTVDGEVFGCDDKLLPVVVGENLTPQETLNKLLSYIDEDNELYNVFANTETPLVGKIVNGKNGKKRIELTGEGLGGGMCDSPRITVQLVKTMEQFEGFENVEIFFNGEPIDKYLSENDEELTLLPPEGDKIYFGAFPDFGGPEDNVKAATIEKFNKLAGKPIKWAYFSNNWGRDGVKFPREKVEVISKAGTIPFVRMMPRKILDTAYDKTYSFQKIIDGNFDEELHQYAKDVKDYGSMILMDYGLEMNGNWFPWSGAVNGGGVKTKYGSPDKADGPERFVDAYRHIVDIFREENVENVTWFFHPDVYSEPNVKWNQPKEYYPGDDYVDWIGISAYGPQNPDEDYWDTFPEIMRDTQKGILEITKGKPRALLEFGVTDHHPLGKKSTWLAGAFKYILDKNSPVQFQAISLWHENWEEEDDLWATLRLDSSAGALATFKKFIADERFVGGYRESTN